MTGDIWSVLSHLTFLLKRGSEVCWKKFGRDEGGISPDALLFSVNKYTSIYEQHDASEF